MPQFTPHLLYPKKKPSFLKIHSASWWNSVTAATCSKKSPSTRKGRPSSTKRKSGRPSSRPCAAWTRCTNWTSCTATSSPPTSSWTATGVSSWATWTCPRSPKTACSALRPARPIRHRLRSGGTNPRTAKVTFGV